MCMSSFKRVALWILVLVSGAVVCSFSSFRVGRLIGRATEDLIRAAPVPGPASSRCLETQLNCVEVVFATTDIPRGTRIDSSMVAPLSYPPDYVWETTIRWEEVGSIIGRRARVGVERGLILTSGLLEPP